MTPDSAHGSMGYVLTKPDRQTQKQPPPDTKE